MPITTRTSVITQPPGRYETVTVELDDPRQNEVTVKLAAAGLCHSDDHNATGDLPPDIYPYAGGHEGAGVITAVGPDTPGFEVGDHVVFSFLPACGKCEFCARGMSNLCDLGASLMTGSRAEDPGSFRMHLPDGTPVGQQCGISTFSEYTTASTASVIKIDKSLPLKQMALLSCGVPTGWGSAVNSAKVQPGDTVIVMGIGGIGANALQGAAHAGALTIIAVDPVATKQDKAKLFGATHFYTSIAEATEYARSITNGQGADSTIITVGLLEGQFVAEALASIRKAGTVVLTGLGPVSTEAPIVFADLTLMQKRLQGSLFGESNPRRDIPNLIRMYQKGMLKLDELITAEYTLDQIAEGYDDMHAGKNIRGVVVFD